MSIKKIAATISAVTDTTPTARVVTLTLSEPLPFIAGAFVNLFIEHEGTAMRRAFSISSSDTDHKTIDLTIRLSQTGVVSPLFWREDIVGTKVEVMGPLGLNTADKMHQPKTFLFGFGVGAGVVKSLATHFVQDPNCSELTIMLGSRNEDEIVHLTDFEELATEPKVTLRHATSNPGPHNTHPVGYVQDHLAGFDFNNADVYVCGQEVACNALVETVKKQNPQNCAYFVEGFH
jgi:NAD(P)H-flavin reductase